MTPTTTNTLMTGWLENAWLTRYLDHQLTVEEAAWFEAYVLDKPELLAMIDADTHLRDAFSMSATTLQNFSPCEEGIQTDETTTAQKVTTLFRGNNVGETSSDARKSWRRLPAGAAIAASLVLGLALGWQSEHLLLPESAPLALVASPTRIIFDTLRGEAAPPRIEHADSQSPYVLIEVAVPPGAEQIVLKVGGAKAQALSPSPDGFVSFLLSRKSIFTSKDTRIEYVLENARKIRNLEVKKIKQE